MDTGKEHYKTAILNLFDENGRFSYPWEKDIEIVPKPNETKPIDERQEQWENHGAERIPIATPTYWIS